MFKKKFFFLRNEKYTLQEWKNEYVNYFFDSWKIKNKIGYLNQWQTVHYIFF